MYKNTKKYKIKKEFFLRSVKTVLPHVLSHIWFKSKHTRQSKQKKIGDDEKGSIGGNVGQKKKQ